MYFSLFRKARAVESVLSCLHDSAICAAANACYEAFHATQDMEALTQVGRRTLTTSVT
jgi:hypothetical protein